MVGQPAPHERHPYPCQRAYGDFRRRILTALTTPRRHRLLNDLQHIARAGFLILDMPTRWLMDLCDAVSGNRGYLAVGSVLAAYLAAFGLIDTKSTQEETRASVERSLFMTLVSSGNAASFIAAMKDFGPIQSMPVTEHPSLLKFWQWGRTYQPNRDPMQHWAGWRLYECSKEAKDCSLTGDERLDLLSATLTGADLRSADLRGAVLHSANLTRADLRGALLSGANLMVADLREADLREAYLDDAELNGADLREADLRDAFLNRADLDGAKLDNANLGGAVLDGAKLGNANLGGAQLIGATDLTQAQLDQACGGNVKLDPGLTIKPCPK